MIDGGHPVLSCAEAVELEGKLLQGNPEREWEAMQRAGTGLARALLLDLREIGPVPPRLNILVFAAKGHNAGDALIAVEEMARRISGVTVEVCFVLGEQGLNALTRRAWKILLGGEATVSHFDLAAARDPVGELRERCGKRFDVFIDGMFGMNFRPPFRGPLDGAVRWVNEELQADLRAAVDLPSGLSDEPADLALRADFTYMTGIAKAPNFEPENARWTGRIRYLDIGFFEDRDEKRGREILLPETIRPLRQLRSSLAHKRHFGHLAILGGSRRMPGAILMSIRAAAGSGAGLLTALVPESMVAHLAPVVPEAMWIGCPETPDGGLALEGLQLVEHFLPQATALLMGPGIGKEEETLALMTEVAGRAEIPVVVDAEALQPKLVARLTGSGRAVLTPHAGEYARIAGRDFGEDGEAGLLKFCQEAKVVTLLKGPPFTRICDGARVAYSMGGGPVLARGGSGDLLAGILGGMVAQAPDRLWRAACRAAVWHGMAADALARDFGQEAVRSTQLLDYLAPVLRGEK